MIKKQRETHMVISRAAYISPSAIFWSLYLTIPLCNKHTVSSRTNLYYLDSFLTLLCYITSCLPNQQRCQSTRFTKSQFCSFRRDSILSFSTVFQHSDQSNIIVIKIPAAFSERQVLCFSLLRYTKTPKLGENFLGSIHSGDLKIKQETTKPKQQTYNTEENNA